MICTGSSNWSQNRAARLGWRVTTVCTASRSRCGSSGPVTVISSCTAYTSSLALRGAGVKQQPLLQRGQRQNIGDPVLPLQLVDLLLAQPGRRDIRRGQPAPTVAHMRADPGQGLKPQPAQPADLRVIKCRGRPRPVGLQLRAGVGVDGDGVELHGVHQRHRHRRGRRRSTDKPSWQIRHTSPDTSAAAGAQPPQIVEPDRRVRPGQVNIGVQIAQHTRRSADPAARAAALWRP